MKVDSFYICPWSLQDPLCRSQCLSYVRGLVSAGYRFAFMTFEIERFSLPSHERERLSQELKDEGIIWYPVRWDQGVGVASKLKSIAGAIAVGIRAARRHKPKMVHSRSSLPVAVALTLRKLFGLKFLYDADSVLSEEYVDVGHLSRESRGFKLMARSEAAARRHADHMIVLTESLRNRLLPEVDTPIDVIPCCVDTGRFVRSEGERAKRRAEMGVSGGQQVLVYVGKPGSWYLIDETFEFFRAFSAVRPGAKLLVVTQAEREVFDVTAERLGIIRTDYFVRSSSPEEVPNWLSVADAGLSLIRQVDSKSGSSPVKFAEYLSCGLPVVTTDRIGDCTAIVRSDEVGAVVDVPDRPGLAASAAELAELLDAVEPKALAERCRKTAETHFHMQTVGVKKYREIYERLLGQARGPLHD